MTPVLLLDGEELGGNDVQVCVVLSFSVSEAFALREIAFLYIFAMLLPCWGILFFFFTRRFSLRSCLVSSMGYHLASYEPRMKSKSPWRVEIVSWLISSLFKSRSSFVLPPGESMICA